MTIDEVIASRRNIKMFKPNPVDRDQVISWLDQARMAPNHKMTEPWEVLFIGDKARAAINHKNNFGNAPMLMAVLSHRGTSDAMRDENLVATASFIHNFNLLAWENGIGTYWSSLAASSVYRDLLGITEDYDVVGLLGIGYPEVVPDPKPRTPIKEKVRDIF